MPWGEQEAVETAVLDGDGLMLGIEMGLVLGAPVGVPGFTTPATAAGGTKVFTPAENGPPIVGYEVGGAGALGVTSIRPTDPRSV